MRRILFTLAALMAMHSVSAFDSACQEYYPKTMRVKSAVTEICLEGFAVGYSHDGMLSLYSTEFLTKDDIVFSRMIKRKTSFHEESRLPNSIRASATDFSVTGYDRGHLTPFKDRAYSYDVNSFANIVLQESGLNRGAWMQLEDSVRDEIENVGSAYVVTGAVKSDNYINGLNVPSYLFKVVVFTTHTEYHIAENKKDALVRRIPKEDFIAIVDSISVD